MLKPLAIAMPVTTADPPPIRLRDKGPLYLYHGPHGYFWYAYMKYYVKPTVLVFDSLYVAMRAIRSLAWDATML